MTQAIFTRTTISSLLVAVILAGCGGGGGSTPTPPQPTPTAAAPTPTSAPPTPTAAPQAQGNLPLSEAVAGSPGWVNPSSHKTLYFLDVDTATGATCTAGCLAVWPVFAPTSGSVASANMTIITRSDGSGQQWAYQGHPLYTFAGDSGADQANGDNVPDFGGHWHVARPAASSATPPPGGNTPPPCIGSYC